MFDTKLMVWDLWSHSTVLSELVDSATWPLLQFRQVSGFKHTRLVTWFQHVVTFNPWFCPAQKEGVAIPRTPQTRFPCRESLQNSGPRS